MIYRTSIHGVYKPTNITGGHHPVSPSGDIFREHHDHPSGFSTVSGGLRAAGALLGPELVLQVCCYVRFFSLTSYISTLLFFLSDRYPRLTMQWDIIKITLLRVIPTKLCNIRKMKTIHRHTWEIASAIWHLQNTITTSHKVSDILCDHSMFVMMEITRCLWWDDAVWFCDDALWWCFVVLSLISYLALFLAFHLAFFRTFYLSIYQTSLLS